MSKIPPPASACLTGFVGILPTLRSLVPRLRLSFFRALIETVKQIPFLFFRQWKTLSMINGTDANDLHGLIQYICSKVKADDFRLTTHAIERSIERGIDANEIKRIILSGEIIEYYPEDKYGPTCLIRGMSENGDIYHVLCAVEPVWIITAYDPSLKKE